MKWCTSCCCNLFFWFWVGFWKWKNGFLNRKAFERITLCLWDCILAIIEWCHSNECMVFTKFFFVLFSPLLGIMKKKKKLNRFQIRSSSRRPSILWIFSAGCCLVYGCSNINVTNTLASRSTAEADDDNANKHNHFLINLYSFHVILFRYLE